jgi:hypothetical protein
VIACDAQRLNPGARPSEERSMFPVALLCVGVTFSFAVRYLVATRALVAHVRETHTGFWREELGACRWVRQTRRRALFELRITYYLEPTWPYLRWLLRGEADSFGPDTAELHARARRCLIWGTASLLATLGVMLLARSVG